MRGKSRFQYDPYCRLYLPLYELDGASFMSRDAYGHLCTAGTSTWTPQGHSFTTDDLISIPDHDCLDFGTTGNFSFLMWASVDSATAARYLIVKEPNSTPYNGWGMFVQTTGKLQAFEEHTGVGGYISVDGLDNLAGAGFFFAAATIERASTTGFKLYVNNVFQGTADPTAANDMTNAALLYIGTNRSGAGNYHEGKISEVAILARAVTPQEIEDYYLETKWRYQ